MNKKITFTNFYGVDETFMPEPASKNIPEWYKKTNSYSNGKKIPTNDGNVQTTIKKCVPVFDALTSGYLIFTHVDIYVSMQDGAPYYQWSSTEPLDWHPVMQAENHPKQNGFPYPKFVNPWSIKTEKGYSVLVTQPIHRDAPFRILEGIVDTDLYDAPINFPFTLNDPTWEGLIPAGTPIAQIIPFKRDKFVMKIGNEKDKNTTITTLKKLKSSFFDTYRNYFWTRKEYK
jgi:hypothetical protein